MKRKFNIIVAAALLIACAFVFLAVCNWSLNIGEWNGFSRFLFALFGLGIIFKGAAEY